MAATGTTSPPRVDRARFYTIEGQHWPSVTTILDIIAKPALGPWYAKEERRYFEAAMLEVLSRPGARDPEYVLTAVAEAVSGVKAADRAKQQAASIGTAMHAGIEWALRTQLEEDAGPEPRLPDAAAWAVESWKDWAKSVALEPLAIERTVYCEVCGYAGTLDLYARVSGVLTVLDWKRQGDLSGGLPPERRVPACGHAPRDALGAGADRAAAQVSGRPRLGGDAGPGGPHD
jgi:hypothetical protein